MSASGSLAAASAPRLDRGQHPSRVRVWDLPLRIFHWMLVLAITVAFLSSEEGSSLNQWHVLSGWIATILVVFRVAWGFVGGEHSRFSDFIRPSRIAPHISALLNGRSEGSLGHNPLGAVSVVLLLALIALTVWTGAFGGEAVEDLHEAVAYILLAMIALHVIAVIIMSLIERENLVRSMITGNKRTVRHPGAKDARPPTLASWLVAAAVVAATVYGILQYDPQAFSPRSAASFEDRAGGGFVGSDTTQRAGEEDDD